MKLLNLSVNTINAYQIVFLYEHIQVHKNTIVFIKYKT